MGCFADDTAFWTVPSNTGRIKSHLLQKELNQLDNIGVNDVLNHVTPNPLQQHTNIR